MRVLVYPSAHALEYARVWAGQGRSRENRAKSAGTSILAPWRKVVLPISMLAVARALPLRGPSRPVSPRAPVVLCPPS